MKRKFLKYVIIMATCLIGGLLLAGCAGTKIMQLSGQDFLKQAEQTNQISSFNWTSYIGCTDQRAYLEYGYPAMLGNGTRVTVYWTPISELPSNVVAQIKAGAPPWKNWRDRVPKPAEAPFSLPGTGGAEKKN